jgi:hypothetical protein
VATAEVPTGNRRLATGDFTIIPTPAHRSRRRGTLRPGSRSWR